jgi:hypothetical protein
VLFGDADIVSPVRKLLVENVDAGARRHCRRDGNDPIILAAFLNQRLAEDPGVGRRIRLRFCLRAGDHIELRDAVILVGSLFGRA